MISPGDASLELKSFLYLFSLTKLKTKSTKQKQHP